MRNSLHLDKRRCTVNMLKMNSDHLGRNDMANSKDVVVTGVSTGIGWGTTKVLVSKGFRVFGSVRKQADADRLQKDFGNGFVPLIMDVTDADAVHQAAQKVGSMIGDRNLVGLVNNASDSPKPAIGSSPNDQPGPGPSPLLCDSRRARRRPARRHLARAGWFRRRTARGSIPVRARQNRTTW